MRVADWLFSVNMYPMLFAVWESAFQSILRVVVRSNVEAENVDVGVDVTLTLTMLFTSKSAQ